MNYVLSRKPCYEFNTKTKLQANVWYNCVGKLDECLFVFENGAQAWLNDKAKKCSFNYSGNSYYILAPSYANKVYLTTIKYQNKQVQVAIGSNLCVTIDGELLLDKQVGNIEYIQHQLINNHLIIYFTGDRAFFIIIKDNKLLAADFYDELNCEKEDVFFLKRLHDSINHGKVFCITSKGFDEYLVYLDNYDLNLKEELLPAIMLDLVRAKNYVYAKSLLKNEMQPKQAEDIGKFFLDYDDYLPITNTEFCLLKNDTFVGIVKFEIVDNKIKNILIM